ncbi:MAG: hypothetical protein EU535_08285 [Promethearchaeota archaeon]|nr:MAG: hypothetical protein EU535_08285 [Candidatus Lokiarchaeota archaeon]
MKYKYVLIVYILILIIFVAVIPSARASNYKIGADEGDEFIWKCNVYNKNEIEDILGKGWNDEGLFEKLELGARMRWRVIDTYDDAKLYSSESKHNETAFTIKFAKWFWTYNEKWGDRDSVDELSHFKNPEDYSEDLIFFQFAPVWLPLPLGDYLKKIDLYKGYTIDARVLPSITCKIEKNDIDDDYPKEIIKIVAMYNDKGILTSYKLYINDHQVLIDISLESFITINFLLLSIFSTIIYFGILYFIYKGLKS